MDHSDMRTGGHFSESDQYKMHLRATDERFYQQYTVNIGALIGAVGTFLDVGCGTGTVLRMLSRTIPASRLFGVDVSEHFIAEIRRTFPVVVFDGKQLPFGDATFDVVGSFTVLEHCADPYEFIREKIRVCKIGGHIITACPNFVSPFNDVRGYSLAEKTGRLLRYIAGGRLAMNEPIIREVFRSDDDAIVVTSIPPVIRALKESGCAIIAVRGIMSPGGRIKTMLSGIPIIRLLLPSCYIIARKKAPRGKGMAA